ncbi:hypothetical protein GYMLUDRAFT_76203 [Collybiopsis luxurians FD-317 M1]|uniref:Unplaced genomic scaffold GYMLUscaffold_51, whole genome shotgun sequence n=1 Tax=Collybiopsis luxurians FD-317 M1 TaxID=944289 RepID=A0A0D0CM46_9AGAR|nr:hypothetical protein GYMLUDRAFT_76203 [Collybiopsis luxurians FD-317 M1]
MRDALAESMKVPSILKVLSLSLLTTKASVLARPVSKDTGAETGLSFKADENFGDSNLRQVDPLQEGAALNSVSFPTDNKEAEDFLNGRDSVSTR